MSIIRKAVVYCLLIILYSLAYLVALVSKIIPRRSWKPSGRIMITGRFDNPNWYLSHLTPICHSDVSEIIVISDSPQLAMEKVRFVCPPVLFTKLIGRAFIKAVWMFIAALRYRPDLFMGYHLIPSGCITMIIGKLFGRPCCYQMTGGPTEIIGGGYGAIDSFEGTLGRPSALIEHLALSVVRQFELIVVRGTKAKAYLQDQGVKGKVEIITGSTMITRQTNQSERDIDLVFIGRLTPIKQLDILISVVSEVQKCSPDTKAAIVGDGPLMDDLQAYAYKLGLKDNLEFLGKRNNVVDILNRSRVFLLTSKSEGLSIAMAEAMAAGVVPVVADVGELGDLVVNSHNGFLVESDSVDDYSKNILSLLRDQAFWDECSHKAAEAARNHCDVGVISDKWKQHIHEVITLSSSKRKYEDLN